MSDKAISKHLINLEKHFSASNPILQRASQVFHQLDQLEFELGLLDADETTARKTSWWPIISLIGGFSPAKTEFLTRYLKTHLQSSHHKFTVLQYSPQSSNINLPGTALDADHRLPFYQISQKMGQISPGEDKKINAYLEAKTIDSEKIAGKLFITTPVLDIHQDNPVVPMLNQYVIDISDQVLVFCDLFDAPENLTSDIISEIIRLQDTNKFIYIIDHSEISLDAAKTHEIVNSWQRRLAELGLRTGQFIVLSETPIAGNSIHDLEQRMNHIENERNYRVLANLEQSIRNINELYIPEVEDHLVIWKDRVNMSTLIILGLLVSLLLFGEVTMGLVQSLIDPIIGPIFLAIILLIMIPLHLMMARIHSGFIIKNLLNRQKELNLIENLSGMFENSLTFWRMILPINEPVGKNKKIRLRIKELIEKTKNIVQSLNDQFSHYPHLNQSPDSDKE